ncbi:hypothetical protein BJ508DRAFT_414590 [Ascobolus immersus RN42]|uniref:Uncharacterized protein n=1 Tax=Ascobolus immersus RN42 TaxID=1160509 RepID=A0A3N4I727_ASCIM|nr:hypothetical protein BJ508DRAFT_414590 [Ascobolus immersus RN42]
MNLLFRSPESRFELPEALREPVRRFVLFYYDNLEPYFVVPDEAMAGRKVTLRQWKFQLLNDYLYSFLKRLTASAEVYPSRGDPLKVLVERHERGLLRKEQAILVGRVLASITAEIRSILREAPPSIFARMDDEARGVFIGEIQSASERGGRVITDFLCNERFRAERLEVLILRYLDQDGVNLDVAREVDEATKLWIANGRHHELPGTDVEAV